MQDVNNAKQTAQDPCSERGLDGLKRTGTTPGREGVDRPSTSRKNHAKLKEINAETEGPEGARRRHGLGPPAHTEPTWKSGSTATTGGRTEPKETTQKNAQNSPEQEAGGAPRNGKMCDQQAWLSPLGTSCCCRKRRLRGHRSPRAQK